MIRTLIAEDAEAMAELHQNAITPSWPKADMQDHLTRDICIGYGQPVCGFIIARTAADQGEILTIVTDPERRKTGIGKALLAASEAAARRKGIDILFLEVAADNAPAIALYKSSGYEAYGRRPAYYRRENGRVAAISFRKRLDA